MKKNFSSISSKIKSGILSSFVLILCSFALIYGSQLFNLAPEYIFAQSAPDTSVTTRLSNYAWSDNIGWISFKDGSAPVIINNDGTLSGFAWSEHIGWIKFGNLSGFPNNTYGTNARLEGGKITGWARVISGIAPIDPALDNRGGFDGWISLSGSNYGVSVNGSNLSGYAWGGEVVGWIDFSGVVTTKLLKPCTGPYGTNIPDGQNFTFFSAPDGDGQCSFEVRTCTNGNLSGTYKEIQCGVQKNSCEALGKVFKDGDTAIFYSKSIAGTGQTCESLKTELQCMDGQFVNSDGEVDTIHRSLKCINNPGYTEI